MKNIKVGIIISSTRKGRAGEDVAKWTLNHVKKDNDVSYEIIDLLDYNLPFYGTENNHSEVARWNKKLNEFDGFIFITAEYNHSITGVLKNAIDSAKDAWFNKAAGIVSYGSSNGARAAEHLRSVLTELQVANVRQQVMFSLFEDFTNWKFNPRNIHQENLDVLIEQLIAWSKALVPVRNT